MSVEDIKKGLATLSADERKEVTAFLFHLRHSHDSDYQNAVSERLADRTPSNWLTPDEFEKRLDQR